MILMRRSMWVRDPRVHRDCEPNNMCVTISLASYFASLAIHEFKVIVFKAKEWKKNAISKISINFPAKPHASSECNQASRVATLLIAHKEHRREQREGERERKWRRESGREVKWADRRWFAVIGCAVDVVEVWFIARPHYHTPAQLWWLWVSSTWHSPLCGAPISVSWLNSA